MKRTCWDIKRKYRILLLFKKQSYYVGLRRKIEYVLSYLATTIIKAHLNNIFYMIPKFTKFLLHHLERGPNLLNYLEVVN